MKQKLFGTSGIRGYAHESETKKDYATLTNNFCYAVTRAFLAYAAPQSRKAIFAIGMDLRPSSPRIKDAVIQAILDEGCVDYNAGNPSYLRIFSEFLVEKTAKQLEAIQRRTRKVTP